MTDTERLAALRANQAMLARARKQDVAGVRERCEIQLLVKANADGLVLGETLAVAYAPDGRIAACRAPSTLVYEEFRRQTDKGGNVEPDVQYRVVNPTLYYPDQVEAQAIFKAYPQTVELLAVRACNLVCEQEEVERKKA